MIKDWQAGACACLSRSGMGVGQIARRLEMAENTARKYQGGERLPSQRPRPPREYRTRPDPLAEFWPAIAEMLAKEPRLKPFALLQWLKEQHPERVTDTVRRSLERRVKQWKLDYEVQQEAMFPQDHVPGDVLAFDFVDLRELGVTIRSQPFPHLMFHAVYTFSNWEYVERCHSESFEALSLGLQNALHWSGGAPRRVRSDSLTAAVNNLSSDREFQPRYAELLAHYGVAGHRINVRKPHENGDVESSHGHWKEALRQALYLRGNSNFDSAAEYDAWARGVMESRNRNRQAAFRRELEALRPLPHVRLPAYSRHELKVRADSLLHIRQNTYSVNSKFIGLKLEARVQADEIELWYSGQCVERLPRQFGTGQVLFDYRHVIDSLIRKPGAFRNYRYVQHLYPTLTFRQAYDQLCREHRELPAVKHYLRILEAAKYDGQDRVEDALRGLLAGETALTADAVLAAVRGPAPAPLPSTVNVELPDLNDFDRLLIHKEVYDEPSVTQEVPGIPIESLPADNLAGGIGPEPAGSRTADRPAAAGGTTEGIAAADLSGGTSDAGRSRGAGALDAHAISGGTGGAGVPGPDSESGDAIAAELPVVVEQDLESIPMVAAAAAGGPTVRAAADGPVPGSAGECVDLRQTGLGEDESAVRAGGRTGPAGPDGSVHDLPVAGATPAGGQTGLAAAEADPVAGPLRGVDHRRPGLRPAESRGNGGAVHAPGRTLRTGQRAVEQQSAVLQVGPDLQGPHDDRRGHRSPDPSLGDHRAEHPQLPPGTSRRPPQTPRVLRRLATAVRGLLQLAGHPANLIVAKVQN